MPDETHILESLPAYALGCLDEAETRRVAEHLASCTLCRSELNLFQAVVEQLALTAPDAAPPPDLKRQLMDRVQELRPASLAGPQAARWPFQQRLRPGWAMVALLLIVALAVANLLLWQRIDRLELLIGPQGMRAIALHSTDVAPQASGFVIISADGANGAMVVDAMPLLEPEQQYQVWLVRNGETTSGGLFAVDESGYRGLRIEAPDSLLEYSAVRVTIEPAEGSPYPTGEPVLDGSLHNP
ncbi:MAG: anti-sigma factor [Chloroflexi bacterium]|nr:anti-sigma factor [Chloroflexota bacterium]MCI0579524.1 anti-sigma factor [Chloroflexota bacterium]MCI0644437.1 anti-sigma factor [Chloroflexota bacterium]MCI0725399.1 anti-sigma factor [Chloroflexota bacterium]